MPELDQIEAGKALLKGALEARWPLWRSWGESAWSMSRSRAQDGQAQRLAVTWSDGPTADKVITLAESLAWPVDVPVTLSLRRWPERDPRKPVLHTFSRTINE